MDLSNLHNRLLLAVAALLALTLVGMVVLWPRAADLPDPEVELDTLVGAEVVAVRAEQRAPDPVLGDTGTVLLVTVEVLDGPDAGEQVELEVLPEGYPTFVVGDRVELDRMEIPDEGVTYFIVDFYRLPVLGLLFGLFVLAVLGVGRWHGLRSLLGLGLSLLIVVRFIVPAILAGSSPPVVALVGALAIMIISLYLTHGVSEMTTAAIVGTGAALVLTVGLAMLFVEGAKVTGYASDDANLVRFAVEGVDLQGLVLAGLIIAALGVLDDVTISQASTVFALHDTDRRLGWSPLFQRAMKVGRDHIASVVNTLFLAYAGASLVLLVLFSTSGLPAAEILNSEVLAEEIVKTVVGSLGLIAAVPLTTALAAAVAVNRPSGAPAQAAGHGSGRPPAAVESAPSAGTGSSTLTSAAPQSGGSKPPAGSASDPEPLDDDERARRAWARYLQQRQQGDSGGTGSSDPS